jgi:hypothetical protein
MDDTAHVELELTVRRGPAREDTPDEKPADEPAEKEPEDGA